MKLDAMDAQILAVLRGNGRITNAALAERVGLSPSACHRRVAALERSGVIRGYAAIVEDRIEQGGLTVIVHITLDRQTDDWMRKFEAGVRKFPEVRECYLMGGGTDYLLRLNVADMADYERVHSEALSRLPGVARIQSSFAIRDILRPAI